MNNAKEYTIEFKQEAARLVMEKGYSQAQAGRSLGISPKNISRWIRELSVHNNVACKKMNPDQEEIRRLTKENQRLRMEREILKKAAAFFANEKA